MRSSHDVVAVCGLLGPVALPALADPEVLHYAREMHLDLMDPMVLAQLDAASKGDRVRVMYMPRLRLIQVHALHAAHLRT